MKSAVRFAGTILLALGASTITANAQGHSLKTQIPFTFMVGDTPMSAGEYTIISRDSFLVIEKSRTATAIQSFESHTEPGSGNKLVFYQYGNQYFLHEVSSPNNSLNRVIAPCKAEKGARQRAVPTIIAVR